MLKNQSPLTLALALMASLSFASGALALDYTNRQGNKATFETLEETRVRSVAAAASQGSGEVAFKSHPVLDGYPKGTTYVICKLILNFRMGFYYSRVLVLAKIWEFASKSTYRDLPIC